MAAGRLETVAWRRRSIASFALLAFLSAAGCSGPPADDAPRRAAARAALESTVGPFPEHPAGGAAGLRLREAMRVFLLDEAERPLLRRLSKEAAASWSDGDRRALAEVLGKRGAAWTELRAAAQALPGGLGIPVPLPENSFPDLRPLLDSSRVLVVDAREAVAAGESSRAVEDVRSLGGLLHAAYAEPWLLTQLLASAGERHLGPVIADALAAGDAAVLDEVLDALRLLDSVPQQRWIAGEASLAERNFTRAGGEGGAKDNAGFQEVYGDLVVAKLYERYAKMAELAAGGWPALGPWFDELDRKAKERAKMDAGRWLRLALSPARRAEELSDTVADLLWSSLVDAIKKSLATRSLRGLAELALDLARERRQGNPVATEVAAGFRNDYTGEVPVLESRADGSLRLSLPLTEAAWKRDFPVDLVAPRLAWELPPPAQSPKARLGTAAARPRS
jgi:hypothetical protein